VSRFSFTTRDFTVGYDQNGFRASGETTRHDLPELRGEPLLWMLDTAATNQWDHYAGLRADQGLPLTERAELLQSHFPKLGGPPVGLLMRDEVGATLSYSLPNDPALAAFVTGVWAADRELVFSCYRFDWVPEGKLAPGATEAGFMERQEPVFLYERPILRGK